MGATKQTITSVYYNNSKTPTTVTQSVDSEIVVNETKIDGTDTFSEVPRQDAVYPGVIGGTKPNL
jgi:hypothetical protein